MTVHLVFGGWVWRDDATAYRKRSVAYSAKQEIDKAIADCTNAININPDDYRSYLFRSVNYQRIGNTTAAVADLATAKELGYQPEQ